MKVWKYWIPLYGIKHWNDGGSKNPLLFTFVLGWQVCVISLLIMVLYSKCSAQSWSQIVDYPHVITQVKISSNGDIYATKQQGDILRNGAVIKSFPVQYVNECGLVGFDFAQDGFYLHISSPDSVQRVLYYDTLSGEIDTLIEVSYKQPYSNRHRGGTVLYSEIYGYNAVFAGFGYGANRNDAGNLNTYRGKLLYVFHNNEEAPDSAVHVLAYGLRNPFRFDVQDDMMYIADVGADSLEEIDYFSLVLDSLEFYGWPCAEGTYIHLDTCEQDIAFPVYQYPHNGFTSITGGCWWANRYYFCDFYSGIGGAIDTLGGFEAFPVLFPESVTSVCVNPVTNGLVVSTWAGNIFEYGGSPLSLPEDLEEDDPRPDPRPKKYIYVDVLGRIWNYPPRGISSYKIRVW